MQIRNQTFTGKEISLDGCNYKDCNFINCKMTFEAKPGTEMIMDGCNFDGCGWHLDGAAKRTAMFLQALYAMKPGGESVVNDWISHIMGRKAH